MRWRDRLVLALVSGSGRGLLSGAVLGLRVRGRRTGEWHELPVQYARDGLDLVVVPGHAERKTWWRNLTEPSPVQVLLDGSWRAGAGRVLWAGDPGYERSLLAYRRRFARARVPLDAPVVRIAPGS